MDDFYENHPSEARKLALYVLATIRFLLLCGWVYALPYLTMYSIRDAAQSGDLDRLEDLVDFTSLRQSIKETLRVNMIKKAGVIEGQDPFDAVVFTMTGAVIDPIVDTAVTPNGIAAMIRGEKPTESKPSTTRETGDIKDGWSNARMDYVGLSKFVVRFQDKSTGEDAIVLMLKRQNFGWQLTNFRMPLFVRKQTFRQAVIGL